MTKYTTTISAAELAELGQSPDLVILDARFTLDDEDWGARAFAEAHIPGAQFANLATDLSGPVIPGVTGRRPFPDPDTFVRTLEAWGIGPDTQVVSYDADNGLMAASRVWLMLRWVGHDRAAVLDGGIQAWTAAGLPLTDATVTPAPSNFVPHLRPHLLADLAEVDAVRCDADWCVFDSRSEEGYHGGGKYHDPVRGHIAGAGLADRASTIASDGGFRSPAELRAHFDALLDGTPTDRVIFYCGSGVTAAQNVLAMEIAGLPGSRMYVGSWSEWITDPAREIEL
jgi:thiosulfate/3-mercaptopyruvate sulfurtransferase